MKMLPGTLIKILLITFCIVFSSAGFSGTKEMIFPNSTLLALAPPYANKDYYLFEFGFIREKHFKEYNYNVYVTAALFEDWKDQEESLRAGGLGFKAGVMTPTNIWFPLLGTVTVGFAKTVLHRQPIWGREDHAANKKDMFLLEAGLLYKIDRYFIRYAYQISNVKYFNRHTFIELGVTF